MYFHNMKSEHNVFVVDDDPSARKGIARLVRAAGYNVCTHGSANEFLATLNPTVTGCVILDARMPGMSGEDLAAKLTKYRERLSVIFVTADDDPVVKQKANKMGAAGFFRKPVDGTALLDAINWSFNEIDANNQSMK
jgi:two-component system response regulator FixJ